MALDDAYFQAVRASQTNQGGWFLCSQLSAIPLDYRGASLAEASSSGSDMGICPAGGAQQDAVGVCAKEIEDPQLALFLCHMLEGPQGPLQHHLITTHLLPRTSLH